jgi:hypothetical protein
MRERKDILNTGLDAYEIFVNQMYAAANANRVAWNISAATMAAYLVLLNKWNSKWSVSKNKKTANTVDRTETTTARKKLTKFLRPFVQIYIMRNTALTDADIIKCGLQPYKKTKTKSKKPKSSPLMIYVIKGSHIIEAFYSQAAGDKNVRSRGKPLNVAFCKIGYYIGDTPPTDPEDFPKTIITSNNGVRIKFKAVDARSKVTFIACWVSAGNIDGNWCRPQSMYVP